MSGKPTGMPKLGERAHFLTLFGFFFRMEQMVWAASMIVAVAYTAVAEDYGRIVAVSTALLLIGITVIVALTIDGKRPPGRRTLTRGRQVSPRRVIAFAITIGVFSGVLKLVINAVLRILRS